MLITTLIKFLHGDFLSQTPQQPIQLGLLGSHCLRSQYLLNLFRLLTLDLSHVAINPHHQHVGSTQLLSSLSTLRLFHTLE